MSDLPQPPQQAEPASYEPTTAGPVVYLPVLLDGRHVGYLWAGVDDRSATFIRRNEFLDEAYLAPFVWIERLQEAYARGLPAREAVREWIGRPEDPVGGGVPADAREETAGRLGELRELANPGERRPPWASLEEDLFGGGSAVAEEGAPAAAGALPGYGLDTAGPVRYVPVVKDEVTLGYLWAAVEDEAAMYLPRADAGLDGANAAGAWIRRLRDLHAGGVAAEEVLGRCRAVPDDGEAGAVPLVAPEERMPGLQELRDLASVYVQSLRVSYNPGPDDPLVAMREPLPEEEREAVLRYLREAPVVYDGGDPLPDSFDPARPARVPATYHSDGSWVWLGGVAYYLETHGVPPEPDLVRHVRASGARPPVLDAAGEEDARRTLAWWGVLVPPPDPA
ncbi:hypothetical protein [Actinomadura sp. 21ATH]|uniref:hypothetical protein n=1 Tax=Actinomadura sp. 21ATH TaxID=1735444 RepID=UPI0035BEF000